MCNFGTTTDCLLAAPLKLKSGQLFAVPSQSTELKLNQLVCMSVFLGPFLNVSGHLTVPSNSFPCFEMVKQVLVL
jgi:hypothetical protein